MIGLDYGYRSACCYAPIRLGRRRIKNTNKKLDLWVCTRCKKRGINLVEHNTSNTSGSSDNIKSDTGFLPSNYDEDEPS